MRPLARRHPIVAVAAILASVGVAFVGACTLLNPLDAYGPGHPAGPDASPDGGPDAAACVLARWPDRPATDGPSVGDVVLAISTIDLGTGTSPPATPVGYDLDGVCTCPGPPSCFGPATAKPACDLEGGIDTGGTEIIRQLFQLTGSTVEINTPISTGTYGIVLRLRQYNGAADDSQVEVDTFLSGGTEGAQSGAPTPPKFDGNDVWTIDPASLFTPNVPPYVPVFADTHAYVAGGVLVATLDFPLHLGAFDLDLRGSVLTARLDHRPGDAPLTFHVTDGQVAGREPMTSLLTGLDVAHDPFATSGSPGLCGDSGTYQHLKTQLCDAVDLEADQKRDNQSEPCDAVGIAFAFTAGPAKLGSAFAPGERPRLCGDTWKDDCPRQ